MQRRLFIGSPVGDLIQDNIDTLHSNDFCVVVIVGGYSVEVSLRNFSFELLEWNSSALTFRFPSAHKEDKVSFSDLSESIQLPELLDYSWDSPEPIFL